MRIWFHGTDRTASQAIAENGFHAGSWFAESLEDAIEFGGQYVFEVALDHKPVKDGNWQMRVAEKIPASSIVSLIFYQMTKLIDRPEVREAVFRSNRRPSDAVER